MSLTPYRTAAAVALLMLGACGEPDGGGPEGEAGPAQSRPAALDRAALLTASCSGCHAGGGSAIVNLDRLPPGEIATSLNDYRTDTSGTTVMHRLARGYSEEDVAAIVSHLSRQRGE